MTTWERGQQFDSLLGVLVLLMLWENFVGALWVRKRAEGERAPAPIAGEATAAMAAWRRWWRGDDGTGAEAAKAGECGRARCARKTPCGGAGGICAGVRREGAGAQRRVVGARVHPAGEW
jgi:hypothetical protein